MKKKSIIIILSAVIFLIGGIIYGIYLFENNNADICGTYLLEREEVEDNIYIVFNEDGEYLRYMQFDRILQKGRYSVDDGTVKVVYDDGSFEYLEADRKAVYYCDGGNRVKYKKIDNIPSYINIERE